MPRIALMGAMQEELSAVLARMQDARCETVAGRQFWQGQFHGHAVVAVLSGIGKVAAAITATVLIEKYQVQRILFTGVAGGLARHVKVGDVVVGGRVASARHGRFAFVPSIRSALGGPRTFSCRQGHDGVFD